MEALDQVTVIIADDDFRVRRALRALIDSSPGFTVLGDVPPAAGVETDGCRTGAVILLDVMPSLVAERLSMIRLLSDRGYRVVGMSIQSGLRDIVLDAGACAFVDKGATPDAILRALREAAPPASLWNTPLEMP
jgi:DNA-binding NarL/FixJ family response regulator